MINIYIYLGGEKYCPKGAKHAYLSDQSHVCVHETFSCVLIISVNEIFSEKNTHLYIKAL